MAYPLDQNPLSLMKTVVTTAGTPVRLTAALDADTGKASYGNANDNDNLLANKVEFKTLSTVNTGNIYIGLADMNKTTGHHVFLVLEPGDREGIGHNVGGNVLRPGLWFVDADVSGESVWGWAHVA